MTEITLRIESPHQADVVRLIEALDIYQGGLYPSESNHFLGVEALAAPGVASSSRGGMGGHSAAARSGSTRRDTGR